MNLLAGVVIIGETLYVVELQTFFIIELLTHLVNSKSQQGV